MKLRTSGREKQKRAVTENLLAEMNDLCAINNAELIIVILHGEEEEKADYISYLDEKHITWVDCVIPMTPEMTVVGEGHPNGRMNSLWADRISDELDRICGNQTAQQIH